jgi:hypothetical protein
MSGMSGKAIRETLAALGVIASMVFVGLEIQQNTVASRAAQENDVFDASREIELAVGADPEWSRIVVEGRSGGSLSAVEQHRYDVYVVAVLDVWDQLLTRHTDGLMPLPEIDAWNVYFEEWVKRHLSRESWQRLEWQWENPMPLYQSVEAALPPGSNE